MIVKTKLRLNKKGPNIKRLISFLKPAFKTVIDNYQLNTKLLMIVKKKKNQIR